MSGGRPELLNSYIASCVGCGQPVKVEVVDSSRRYGGYRCQHCRISVAFPTRESMPLPLMPDPKPKPSRSKDNAPRDSQLPGQPAPATQVVVPVVPMAAAPPAPKAVQQPLLFPFEKYL